MRGAIIAGLMAVGLLAGCGGPPEEVTPEVEQSSAQELQPIGPNCRVECWDGSNAGATSQISTSTYSQCETYAMSFCNAASGANGGFWYKSQFYAW